MYEKAYFMHVHLLVLLHKFQYSFNARICKKLNLYRESYEFFKYLLFAIKGMISQSYNELQ